MSNATARIQAQAAKASEIPILESPDDYTMWYCHMRLIARVHHAETSRLSSPQLAKSERMLVAYVSIAPDIRRLAAEHLALAISDREVEPMGLYAAIGQACKEIEEEQSVESTQEQVEAQDEEIAQTETEEDEEQEADEEIFQDAVTDEEVKMEDEDIVFV